MILAEDDMDRGPSFQGYYNTNLGISPHASDISLVSKSNLQDNSSIKRYYSSPITFCVCVYVSETEMFED